MAIPNEPTVMQGNGSAQASPTKKKASKKSGSAQPAASASAPAKQAVSRSSGPIEILFTQEPNPFQTPQPPYIWIDFPMQSEILRNSAYVVRLGVGGADLVEISIDKSPWLPCRLTAGYWWYDWSAIAKGKHTLTARMRMPDGRWFKTPLRQCDYRTE